MNRVTKSVLKLLIDTVSNVKENYEKEIIGFISNNYVGFADS